MVGYVVKQAAEIELARIRLRKMVYARTGKSIAWNHHTVQRVGPCPDNKASLGINRAND